MAVDDERGYETYCFNPRMFGGWGYEAVNYDVALDATLLDDADGDGDRYDDGCGDLRGMPATRS